MKRVSLICLVMLFVAVSLTAYAGTKEPESIAKAREGLIADAVKDVKTVKPTDLVKWMKQKKDFVLLDVREPNETGAFSIPAQDFKAIPRGLLEWLVGEQIPLDKEIVVYCKTGLRAAFAVNTLKALGYKNCTNLDGGIVAWMEAGYPVSTYIGNIRPDKYKYNK